MSRTQPWHNPPRASGNASVTAGPRGPETAPLTPGHGESTEHSFSIRRKMFHNEANKPRWAAGGSASDDIRNGSRHCRAPDQYVGPNAHRGDRQDRPDHATWWHRRPGAHT